MAGLPVLLLTLSRAISDHFAARTSPQLQFSAGSTGAGIGVNRELLLTEQTSQLTDTVGTVNQQRHVL